MRILNITILSLALAMALPAQGEDKVEREPTAKKPAAESTLSTPFGAAKVKRSAAPKAKPKSDKIRPDLDVVTDGERFVFSKKTPFGKTSWTRSEEELSAQERAMLEQRGLLAAEEEPTEEARADAKP